LDERLGLEKLIAEHLSDSRQGLNKQFTLADLLRESVYSRLAGYEHLNDAERLAADLTFRLIGSQKIWGRGRRVGAVSERSITRQQAGLVRRAKTSRRNPAGLAGACSDGKFVVESTGGSA